MFSRETRGDAPVEWLFVLKDGGPCNPTQGAGASGGWREAQQLRAIAALTEDLNSVSSTHTRQLTTACKFSSRGSCAPGSCGIALTCSHVLAHTQTQLKTVKYVFMI